MTRRTAAAASALFLVVVPGTVVGVVPYWLSRWRFEAPFLGMPVTRAAGALLLAAGLALLLDSVARFALQGLGTPAPVLPTQRLVVSGLYRHVRNPMYAGVVSAILGQALLFGSRPVAAYGAAVWAAFHAFVLFYEEPVLARRFGADYAAFRAAVPRWLPRLRPWREPGNS